MLNTYFYRQTTSWCNHPALSYSEGSLSFSEVFNQSDQLASTLEKNGIASGDIVIVTLPNSPEFVCSVLALWKIGAVAALVSPKFGSHEREAIKNNLPCKHVITQNAFTSDWTANQTNQTKLTDRLTLIPIESNGAKANTIPNLAVIKFSSGTTGIPKGIGLTVDNIIAETEGIVQGLGLSTADRILATTPLCHSYGFDLGVLASLGSGATLFISDMFAPRPTMKDIDKNGITLFLGVPSMYRAWCETQMAEKPSLKSLRYMLSCTAPLSPMVIEQFHERFGVPICQHYGSSETGAVSTHLPSSVRQKSSSVGKLMPHGSVRIEYKSDSEIITEGEIVVSGKGVSPGYLMGAPPQSTALGNGEFRTGDIGYLDNDGFLFVTGRVDQIINVGGFKVSPTEVSWILEAHPAVSEAAVAGRNDSSGESSVYAAVKLRTRATEEELIAHCRQHLSEYKVPRRIDIMSDLPKTATGKVKLNQ